MNAHDPFAEVIESNLDHYTAQCWKWNRFPTFGSLVHVEDKTQTIFGVVTQIQTGSIDPQRTPLTYQKTEEQLQAEQPQIFELLTTKFKVQILGHTNKKNIASQTIYYLLPPSPSKIHAFVAESAQNTIHQFFACPDFLHLLFAFAHNIPNLDELLLTIIKQLVTNSHWKQPEIDRYCNLFTLLSGNDYRRLKLFLKRLEILLVGQPHYSPKFDSKTSS